MSCTHLSIPSATFLLPPASCNLYESLTWYLEICLRQWTFPWWRVISWKYTVNILRTKVRRRRRKANEHYKHGIFAFRITGAWDVVVTCFFIDTARNIIKYLEVIHGILKQGGTWINIGPLLYHFEDTPGESSVELSLDQIKRVAQEMGFEIKVTKAYLNHSLAHPYLHL